MGECPNCNEGIEELNYEQSLVNTGSVHLVKGSLQYEDEYDYCWQEGEYRFFCPECDDEIQCADPTEILCSTRAISKVVY